MLYHKLSTDVKSQHGKCPLGESLWQKTTANNTLSTYSQKQALLQTVFNAIKPIYEELSSDDLLTQCLDGFT